MVNEMIKNMIFGDCNKSLTSKKDLMPISALEDVNQLSSFNCKVLFIFRDRFLWLPRVSYPSRSQILLF